MTRNRLARRGISLAGLLALVAALLLSSAALAGGGKFAYNHKRWMQPKDRQRVLRGYMDAAHLPKAHPEAVAALVKEFPALRGIDPNNVRVGCYTDPKLLGQIGKMGHDVPIIGASVVPNGHPYLIVHRSKTGIETKNQAFQYDTTPHTFRDGSRIRTELIQTPHGSKSRLWFLYAGPGDVVRKQGDRTQWYKEHGSVRTQGWSCAAFLTHNLREAGDRAKGDPNNPLGQIWGKASWQAEKGPRTDPRFAPHGHDSSQVGMRSVLGKITQPFDLILLTTTPEQWKHIQPQIKNGTVPSWVKLEVAPQ